LLLYVISSLARQLISLNPYQPGSGLRRLSVARALLMIPSVHEAYDPSELV